jgi:hypothetical protein
MHEPAAAAAHPGLDLIHPQQCAMLIADFTSLREVTLGRDHNTVLALDRLQDDCRHRLVDRGCQSLHVAVRYEDHLARQGLERCAVLLIVSQRQRA